MNPLKTLTVLATAGAAAITMTACSPDVTKARLEQSLAPTFANLYVQQAQLLGHPGVTVASVHATDTCKKGLPTTPDKGPGSDWVCMMTWTDSTGTVQTGKVTVQAKANACYTAAGPATLIGLVTITSTTGVDVTNPLSEFDGCYDPRS